MSKPTTIDTPVSTPADIAASIGAANPTLTARALGLALFQFNLTVTAFRSGRCQSTKVDEAYRTIERVVDRVREIQRDAKFIAEAAFKESCKTPHRLRLERAIGVPPMQGVKTLGLSPLPLVSKGPSGIGGYAQSEILDESGFGAGVRIGGAQ